MKIDELFNFFGMYGVTITAKIKGDAGEYGVYGMDFYNYKLLCDRACGIEWVPIEKIQWVKRTENVYPEA